MGIRRAGNAQEDVGILCEGQRQEVRGALSSAVQRSTVSHSSLRAATVVRIALASSSLRPLIAAAMAAASVTHALSALALGPACADQGSLRPCTSSTPSVSVSLSHSAPKSGGGPQRGRLQIRCARVGGVEIPNAKRVEIALTYIHGVGQTTARQILLDVGLENKVTKELSEEELTTLRDEVSKYMIEGDLRRFNQMAIKRLKDIQCYRGKRHQAGLPCRGQHTKCNARTLRGKKITIAGKKKAPGK